MKDTRKIFILSGVFFLVFVIFTALVKIVDVQAIGPQNSEIGFAAINGAVRDAIGYNPFWEGITDWLGYIAIGVALGFALFAGFQLIKGKSLKAVDPCLLALGGFYVIVVVFYALFEVLVINYRPVILEAELEASYPSSHTMLSVCIMATAMILFARYFREKRIVWLVADVIAGVILLMTVIGRFFAGIHWMTDIIGGLLLSISLVLLYFGAFKKIGNK